MTKEVQNVKVTFKILIDRTKAPIGHQFVQCHTIYDIKWKISDLGMFVAGSHMTEAPASITYERMVSTEAMRIALMISAFHYHEVTLAC